MTGGYVSIVVPCDFSYTSVCMLSIVDDVLCTHLNTFTFS